MTQIKYSQHKILIYVRNVLLWNGNRKSGGRKFRDERVQRKCLTNTTGSETLRPAIDEHWERFENLEQGRSFL